MRKFKLHGYVTILGTDMARGFISNFQPSNTNEYIVWIYPKDIEKVYPYYGECRIYPEWMLEKIDSPN